MLINIPLTIDDSVFEAKFTEDIENKVVARVVNDVETTLAEKNNLYGLSRSKAIESGLRIMVVNAINRKIDEYRDEVIDAAADRLAERLCRTKKAKEILEGMKND